MSNNTWSINQHKENASYLIRVSTEMPGLLLDVLPVPSSSLPCPSNWAGLFPDAIDTTPHYTVKTKNSIWTRIQNSLAVTGTGITLAWIRKLKSINNNDPDDVTRTTQATKTRKCIFINRDDITHCYCNRFSIKRNGVRENFWDLVTESTWNFQGSQLRWIA